MKTEPETNLEIYLAAAVQQNAKLRQELNQAKIDLQRIAEEAERRASKIQEGVDVGYTDFAVILKKSGNEWRCLAIVDFTNPPDDLPEDYDVVVRIPNPETLPDFDGF